MPAPVSGKAYCSTSSPPAPMIAAEPFVEKSAPLAFVTPDWLKTDDGKTVTAARAGNAASIATSATIAIRVAMIMALSPWT